MGGIRRRDNVAVVWLADEMRCWGAVDNVVHANGRQGTVGENGERGGGGA